MMDSIRLWDALEISIGTWLSSHSEHKKQGVDRVDLDQTQIDLFYNEGGETVKNVAQKSCGFSIIGCVCVQFGWG